MKKTKRFLKNHFLISLVLSSFIYLQLATIRASAKQPGQLIIINLLGILSLWVRLRTNSLQKENRLTTPHSHSPTSESSSPLLVIPTSPNYTNSAITTLKTPPIDRGTP
jgi:hypothetical protein